MKKKRLRLLDSDKKSLGIISGINPDATANDIALFVEGINGLRSTNAVYAALISEEMIYMS